MKKIVIFLLCLCSQWTMAQKEAPKWVEKAKQAVFSIVTYDKADKLLNTGNGFFVSEDGIALSDYSVFKGAQRAVIINAEGKKMAVKAIIGANEIYDVIKFKVEAEKKTPMLKIATQTAAKGSDVYLLPYSTQKDRSCALGKIEEVSSLSGKYAYYTLALSLNDKMVSCPVTTLEGQVIGLIQKDAAGESKISYAVDASFAMSLSMNALSANDATLRNIGIKKALPDTENQALVYLFMSSSSTNAEEYLVLLNEFIETFPNSVEGYTRRANHYVYNFKDVEHLALAEKDLEKAQKLTDKKDDIYYNTAKLIYAYQLNKPETIYKDWGYARALKEIQQAITINPIPLYIQLEGDIYFALKDYEKSFVSYEKVNRSNLASAATFYSAAKAKELAKADMGEVIALLDSAIAKFTIPYSQDAAPYLLERAQKKETKELYREAVVDYDTYYQAVNGAVNDVFYYYREQANYKAKNFQRALDDIQKAIELSPEDATYLAELGAINLRIARYDEAIKNLQAALLLDPKFAACYRLIGFCQIQLKQDAEACQNFAKAKELGDEAVKSLIEKHCK
ncbi:MAG: serine protease [Bacteroidaceae bacterium]